MVLMYSPFLHLPFVLDRAITLQITEAASQVREMLQGQVHNENFDDLDEDEEDEEDEDAAMDLDSDMVCIEVLAFLYLSVQTCQDGLFILVKFFICVHKYTQTFLCLLMNCGTRSD